MLTLSGVQFLTLVADYAQCLVLALLISVLSTFIVDLLSPGFGFTAEKVIFDERGIPLRMSREHLVFKTGQHLLPGLVVWNFQTTHRLLIP